MKQMAAVITKRGNSASLIGALKGKLKIKGRILSTGARWHAQP